MARPGARPRRAFACLHRTDPRVPRGCPSSPLAGRWDGCPCRGAGVLRPTIDLHAQLSPAQRGHFFPCPSNPIALRWLLPSAHPVPTADRRCRSPIGRPAAATSSRDRRVHALPGNLALVCCPATPTRALYRWGSGLRACHELANSRADHVETFMRARDWRSTGPRRLFNAKATGKAGKAARELRPERPLLVRRADSTLIGRFPVGISFPRTSRCGAWVRLGSGEPRVCPLLLKSKIFEAVS